MSHGRAARVEPDLSLARRAACEGLGTALLLATVVGSGIMGADLARGNDALALLANSIATGAALVALLLAFGPWSGAHFNPLVTLANAATGRSAWRDVPPYVLAQGLGALAGVCAAHVMFDRALGQVSTHARSGTAQLVSEFVATFGLLLVVRGSERAREGSTALAVGGYITAAYWFTASTSFANPAVTLSRACTDTFSGIRPTDVPGFVAAQCAGAAAATAVCAWVERGRGGRQA